MSLAWPLASIAASPRPPIRPSAAAAPSVADYLRAYGDLVWASTSDSLAAAQDLDRAVDALLREPTAAHLQRAREAWREARHWYGQTEAFRFYGGPIDGEDGPEPRLNAWPLDEAYIDAVEGRPTAGFIQQRDLPLNRELLLALNERGGETHIATGWHAIEFLLWGQDHSASGPGDRPPGDFADGGAPNADRRRQALRLMMDQLLADLTQVQQAWAPGETNFRAHFEREGQESLRRLIVGLGTLSRGEMAGERLEVALATQQQEDEQSCFSDNTHADLIADALGIRNVWRGARLGRDGQTHQAWGLVDLLRPRHTALARQVGEQIDQSLAAAQAIHPPFDQEILGDERAPGRQRVRAAVKALVQQAKGLMQVAAALGIRQLNLPQR